MGRTPRLYIDRRLLQIQQENRCSTPPHQSDIRSRLDRLPLSHKHLLHLGLLPLALITSSSCPGIHLSKPNRNLQLHRLQHDNLLPPLHQLALLDAHLPNIRIHRRLHSLHPLLRHQRLYSPDIHLLPLLLLPPPPQRLRIPPPHLLLRNRLLRPHHFHLLRRLAQQLVMLPHIEHRLLVSKHILTRLPVRQQGIHLGLVDAVERQQVEVAKQPGRGGREAGFRAEGVEDGHGAARHLVAARGGDGVDAHAAAAPRDGAGGGVDARGVKFGAGHALARVRWEGDGVAAEEADDDGGEGAGGVDFHEVGGGEGVVFGDEAEVVREVWG